MKPSSTSLELRECQRWGLPLLLLGFSIFYKEFVSVLLCHSSPFSGFHTPASQADDSQPGTIGAM
ncbi:hypothetical protein E2C01_025824 [Portunus trituberculatus]|uniref:Uncharacterized protein n=1 Tax=Portunus trituberculatus TaxID=210409 RepID=A0A5B7EEC7_PORTR|nr:hypothetical protein [Portunus trituberculatus]